MMGGMAKRSLKLGAMVRATPEVAARVIGEALREYGDVAAAAIVLDAHRVTLWRWCVRLGMGAPSGAVRS